VHLRTTNPIESVFSTVRQGTDRTKGCVSPARLLGLIFKLTRSAENSSKRLRGLTASLR
jgi:putative transposase